MTDPLRPTGDVPTDASDSAPAAVDPPTTSFPRHPAAPVIAGPIEPLDRVDPLQPLAPARTGAVPVARVRPAQRASRARWGIALLITAAVLGATAVGLVLLSAGAATSSLVGHVPADAIGYVEIRLDAPGDQRQNVANVLSKFPGFADQSSLGTKLDEALDQLYLGLTGQSGGYTRDVKPWLGDSAAIAVTGIVGGEPGAVWLINTKNPESARTWAVQNFAPGSTTTTINGLTFNVVSRGELVSNLVGVVGTVLLGGDEASVRAALATGGASTFGQSEAFKEAAASVAGDRLVFAFLDVRQIVTGALNAAGQTPPASGPLSLDSLPAWFAAVVRAESDAVTTTFVVPAAGLGPTGANRTSSIAPALPPTAVGMIEIRDLGAGLLGLLSAAREAPQTREAVEQLDQALKALGGAESLVGWIGDAAVVVVDDAGPLPAGGVVIRAKSADQAAERLLQLKNLVALFGSSAGITTREEMHGATAITVVDLGDIGRLLGTTGGGMLPEGSHVAIAVAQVGDLVIVGASPGFVTAVLDTASGRSLANEDRYRTAIERAGSSNNGQVYLDLPRIIDLVVSQMPAEQRQFYDREIAPYLAPLQAFAAAAASGDPARARIVITVR